jgi:WD40 repeat protein
MAFSPDDKILFSLGSRGGVLRIEEIATGKELPQGKFPFDASEGIALSRDGSYLVINTGVNSRKVFLWKWRDEEPRPLKANFPGRGLGIICLSPDGKLLAGVQDFGTLYVWQVPSGRLLYQMDCPVEDYFFLGDAAFVPNGKSLALTIRQEQSTIRGKILLLDPATGRSQGEVDTRTQARHLAVSADSRLLAGGAGAAVRLYDLATRQEVATNLQAHEHYPSKIVVSRTGFLATASIDNVVRIWDAVTTKQQRTLDSGGWVRAIGLSLDSRLLATSALDDAVRVWDTRNGREIYRLAGHGRFGGRGALGFSPDGQSLFSWGDDFYLREWDMKNGKARRELRPEGFDYAEIDDRERFGGKAVFTPGRKSYVLDFNGHVHLFDTRTGKQLLKFATEGRVETSVAVTPDGKCLVASTWGDYQVGQHPVSMFDLSSGAELQHLLLPGSVGGPVAISPDGRTFATSVEGPQREILVYEIASGKVRARIGVASRVWSLAFFPDCRRLASGLADSAVLVWDVAAPEHAHKEP